MPSSKAVVNTPVNPEVRDRVSRKIALRHVIKENLMCLNRKSMKSFSIMESIQVWLLAISVEGVYI